MTINGIEPQKGENVNLKEKQTDVLDWLKTYWFIVVALFAGSVAWGQTVTKVQTLEEAVKSNSDTQAQVKVLDERTKDMKEEQKYQRQLLEQILTNQQKKSK